MCPRSTLVASLLIGVLGSTVASAQQKAGPVATTVQLPEFSFFAVSTTVVVPDSGGAYLGGIGSSSSSRSQFGSPLLPGGNVGIGRNVGASNMSVHAQIHDMRAMDEALLRLADTQRTQAQSEAIRLAEKVETAAEPDHSATDSISAIRERQAAEDAALQREALAHLEKAQQLEAAGKTGVAKIYYRMAYNRATGDLKRQIAERVKAMESARVAERP